MALRILVILLGTAYVSYRVRLALQLARARRAGDRDRVRALQARSSGIFRWIAGIVIVLFLLLTLVVILNSR